MKLKGIIQINDISTYRSELMGWAILWIMMLHFGFYRIAPLGFIAQYGYAGVDIFMFVSGFGIFFSLNKPSQLLDFYRRRFIRIFPSYYLIGLITSFILFHDTVVQYLFRYTTIGFWIGSDLFGDWYIPSIVLLYVASPIFKKANVKTLTLLITFLLLISFFLVEYDNIIRTDYYFFLYRIPVFLFGMICAYWCQKGYSMKWYYLVLLVGIPIFAILYPHFHEVYRYKYFSVLFLLPFFLCFFVFVSKYIKIFNPFMHLLGKASLEIYLIQMLFFSLIIGHLISRSDFTTLFLIALCSISGHVLHMAITGKRLYYVPALFVYLLISVSVWYAIKWQPLLTPAKSRVEYHVIRHYDDTLRVVMYGDSWVGMHPKGLGSSVIKDRPVLFQSCGIGGLKSGDIYELMFEQAQYIKNGPDYCIVIAGINDANANIGSDYYIKNYELILSHLLSCGVRPIVIEIPDVDLAYVYANKPLKDHLSDIFRAFITASSMYEISGYRTRLNRYLADEKLMDSIVYIRNNMWNPNGFKDYSLYLRDRIHLNAEGYRKLDSCIVSEIEKDLTER